MSVSVKHEKQLVSTTDVNMLLLFLLYLRMRNPIILFVYNDKNCRIKVFCF